MMAKFVKRPVVIEAEQYTHYGQQIDGLCWESWHQLPMGVGLPHIHTLEGVHTVREGDWIITGIRGEKYPCKDDIFRATYDPVEVEREAASPALGG